MTTLVLVLLILAAAAFLVSAFVPVPKVNLVALGLFFWILTLLCQLVNRLTHG